nr:M15 family metallopeptidase [Cupriavidus taiwanensis]
MSILVTCTYRCGAEQDALYAQGRTKPGLKVTNARAGQSRHNDTLNGKPASTAFDFVPLDANSKAMWDGKHSHWQKAGEIGEALGLEWAARWPSFKEMPHLQLKQRP